jgi:hypothetical protein
MVIDHMNAIWFDDSSAVMEFIGRGTFPLFCYAMAMALLKIKEGPLPLEERKKAVRRYLKRLFIFALVTQPFYFYALGGDTVNVIFTLALGVVFAALSFRVRPWHMYLLYAAAMLSMLWVLPIEFGLTGVMLPSAIVLAMRGEKGARPFLFLLLMMINAGGLLEGLHLHGGLVIWSFVALNGLFSAFLPWAVLNVARKLAQRGRFLPKYALYIFYPAHMTLLKLLAPFI